MRVSVTGFGSISSARTASILASSAPIGICACDMKMSIIFLEPLSRNVTHGNVDDQYQQDEYERRRPRHTPLILERAGGVIKDLHRERCHRLIQIKVIEPAVERREQE